MFWGRVMKLTRKQRIQMILSKQQPDRLPTHIIYTPKMGKIISNYYNVYIEELPLYLDRHLITVLPADNFIYDYERGIKFDKWGVGWNVNTEGFHVVENPIKSKEDLYLYKFPDPMDPNLLLEGEELISKYGEEMFICGGHGFVLFEGATCLLGLENFLTYLMTDRDFITELLDSLTVYHVKLAQRMVSIGVDGGMTGDDWGSQRSLLISPELWRKVIKPRISRIWEVYKNAGLPVMHHSCGNVTLILDDLVEIGLDLLNPVQPGAMDQEYIVKRYGDKLSFSGGICNQTILPFGKPDIVAKEVKKTIDLLGRNGGYIIGPSHEVTTDVPIENFHAMVKAIQDKEPWH